MANETLKAIYRNFRELFLTVDGLREIRKFLYDSAYQTFKELKIKPKKG